MTSATAPSQETGTARRRGRPALVLDEPAVLDATVAALAAAGTATSVQDISSRCGVAKTTLIDRFGGKDGLLGAAVERERRRLADHLIAAYAPNRDATAREQVERGFQAFFAYAHDHPAAFAVLFGRGAPAPNDARGDVTAAIAEIIAARFAAAGAELETGAKIIAAVIAATGEAAARLVVEDGLDADVMARFVADLVVNGLEGLDVTTLFEANASRRTRRRSRS